MFRKACSDAQEECSRGESRRMINQEMQWCCGGSGSWMLDMLDNGGTDAWKPRCDDARTCA
jgi:hypothetical protein